MTEIKFSKDTFCSEDSENEKSDWINHFLRPQTENASRTCIPTWEMLFFLSLQVVKFQPPMSAFNFPASIPICVDFDTVIGSSNVRFRQSIFDSGNLIFDIGITPK